LIYGQKIRLRAIERDDLPRFVVWLNDPEVRAGISRFLPIGSAEEEHWFEGLQQEPAYQRPLAIDVREGDRWIHIGSCGFFNFNLQARNAELGILIGNKDFWGRGLGTETMCVLLEYAFQTLNLHRVYLRVYQSNTRAGHIYRKLGFLEEGRLRDDAFSAGAYQDTIVMGILGREWRAQQADEKVQHGKQ
jgi:RimJ/RimL family protein N-acetyltransferase